MLKRQGVIDTWHDRRINAGKQIDQSISNHVDNDEIILLLVSSDFLASDYCYNIEMMRAMERHDAGEAVVIPVILRACDWRGAPFSKLNATPPDGKPITQWADIDEAFFQVAKAVREAASRITSSVVCAPYVMSSQRAVLHSAVIAPHSREPRSSNLRLAKTFTQREKDQFKLDSFDYIARFFENSLSELEARNTAVEGTFRRIDANRFFATVYLNGKDVARCTIYIGEGAFVNGICYVSGKTTDSNTMNESLHVEADDQALFLISTGISSLGQNSYNQKLSQEEAGEFYWGMLVNHLQQK